MVFIVFSFRGVTLEQSHGSRSILIRSIAYHDRMQEIGPGFSLFHYESLLSIGLTQGYKGLIVMSLGRIQTGMDRNGDPVTSSERHF